MGFQILGRGASERATESDGPLAREKPADTGRTRGTEDEPARGSKPTQSLTNDDVFDVLRNSRRRDVLSYLFARGPTATVTELTEHIATAEYGVPVEELTTDQRKRVYTALCQCHLPRLDRFGVVAFDTDGKTVTLREPASQVAPYLDCGRERDVTSVEVALAGVVAVMITLGVLGIGPLGAVSTISWGMVSVFALAGFGLLQPYANRFGPGR